MITTFNDKERAAMRTMGLPEDIDELFAGGLEHVYDVRDEIKEELLGPGLEANGIDLNEYGVALRSALDAIAYRRRELYGGE